MCVFVCVYVHIHVSFFISVCECVYGLFLHILLLIRLAILFITRDREIKSVELSVWDLGGADKKTL